MTLLNPWVAAGLAAVVVPLLVLLYFLKLRRREQAVPSTLLWKRAVQDLQVNAPFQRLRRNLLLLLQLLVLAAALLALARPVIETEATDEASLILLIDHSASMNTVEADGRTRLEEAREQAVRLVRTLNRTGGGWFSFGAQAARTRAMVIAFADQAAVTAPFTTNTTDLVDQIRAIPPTDARTNLQEALTLAEAYLAQTTVELAPDATKQGSKIILFSDGGIADLAALAMRYSSMELVKIGEATDNVGLTALRVQRNYERPEVVNVFLQVQNFGPTDVTTDVSLYLDGHLKAVENESLAAGSGPPLELDEGEEAPPESVSGNVPEGSRLSLSFEFTLDDAGVLEARIARDDALAADNRVYGMVPPPRKLNVLLVTEPAYSVFLANVLAGLPLEQVTTVAPQEYERMADDQLEVDGQSRYDVVIFNKHNTGRLPVGNYLFLASVPEVEGISADDEVEQLATLWWDETHPVLRHVALEYVYIARALQLNLPRQAEVLAEGTRGPLIARYAVDGRQFMLISFAVEQSTWVTKPSFAVFFYNALRYLGAAGVAGGADSFQPGDVLTVQVPPGETAATIVRPDHSGTKVKPNDAGVAYFGATSRVGLYEVKPGVAGRNRFAVNLTDARESDITPRARIKIGGQEIAVGEAITTATPEIWRWFVGGAIVLLLLEWYIYNRRVMI